MTRSYTRSHQAPGRRALARSMRRRGHSYREIGLALGGGKSAAYYWVHGRELWYSYRLSGGAP